MRGKAMWVACIGALWLSGCKHGRDPERPPPDLPAAPLKRANVIATDFAFNPSRIVATPGQPLIVELRNDGGEPHSITFELPGGAVTLDEVLAPGERGELELEAPDQPGAYRFFCPVANHHQLGMVGQLIVERPAEIGVQEIGAGLSSPVMVTSPPDGTGRLFVVDQPGAIRIIEGDRLRAQPFVDLADRMVALRDTFDERGLLGLAFHPGFASNGRVFAYYSAPLRDDAPDGYDHTSRIVELRVSTEDAARVDPDFERIVLEVDQPQANHNGGTLLFGPDGMLYISLGDGGGAHDTGPGHTPDLGNGQDRDNLLGSILRIDVDGAEPYAIPADNPLVGIDGADEIYAYGLRNPYRMSFDRGGERGLLAADAGQALWEEVNVIEAGGNYGWNLQEGTHCFDPEAPEDPPATCPQVGADGKPLRWPVIEFANSRVLAGGLGTVVVGGHVYRGDAIPELRGRYVFAGFTGRVDDRPSGAIFTAAPHAAAELWPIRPVYVRDLGYDLGTHVKGFGEGADGELYVVTSDEVGPIGDTGRVWRMVPAER